MKKRVVFLAVLLFLVQLDWGKIRLSICTSYPFPDQETIDVYGRGGILPGVTVDMKFLKNFYLYGDLGYFTRKGKIVEEEETFSARITKTFLAGGIEWRGYAAFRTAFFLRTGPVFCYYRESAMGETVSGVGGGWEIVPGILQEIGRFFVLEISAGYVWATSHVSKYDRNTTLGGYKIGAAIGIQF